MELEGPSVYSEYSVAEKGKKQQRTGRSILAVNATGRVELHVQVCQLSVC